MPFVIDVDPIAVSILGLPIRWYGLILVVAASVAFVVGRREARRHGIRDDIFADAVFWVAIASLVGGRVLYVLQNELPMVAVDPLHALMIWQGGLSFYGGLVAGLVALALFTSRRGLVFPVVADVAAPAVAIGQAIGHVGCLIGGDSYGLPTNAPWAVIYANPGAMAPQNVPLHPTQAYEAILLAALFVGLWLSRERLGRLGDGAVAGAYLLGLAAIRFGLFYLRDEPSVLFGLKTAQLVGLGVAALAIALFIAARQSRGASTTFNLEVSRR